MGRDDEIWLEAERQLGKTPAGEFKSGKPTLGEGHSEHAQEEKAAQQRKDARAPITPTKTAPPTKPAETGKPVWPQNHSS